MRNIGRARGLLRRAGAAMVRRMFPWRKAALAVLLITAGCHRGASPKDEAAVAVQGFLEAVQTGDAKAFEAAVDRPAVRADLRRQLAAIGRGAALDLDGGPSDAALDRMIGPAAFRLVDASGAPLEGAPSRAQAAALIKPAGQDRVCLHDLTPETRCLLTFTREKTKDGAGVWRLVQMPAQDLTIAVAPEPPPAKG